MLPTISAIDIQLDCICKVRRYIKILQMKITTNRMNKYVTSSPPGRSDPQFWQAQRTKPVHLGSSLTVWTVQLQSHILSQECETTELCNCSLNYNVILSHMCKSSAWLASLAGALKRNNNPERLLTYLLTHVIACLQVIHP